MTTLTTLLPYTKRTITPLTWTQSRKRLNMLNRMSLAHLSRILKLRKVRLLNEQAGLFSLLIRLGEQADEQAKPSHTIC